MTFLLDTNVITALIKGESWVRQRLETHRTEGIYLCEPVYYETMRGLLWKKASAKLTVLATLQTELGWFGIVPEDWVTASHLWANAVSQGKQLADMDLLIAAIAIRKQAIVVTNDHDFKVLPVQQVNWRESP